MEENLLQVIIWRQFRGIAKGIAEVLWLINILLQIILKQKIINLCIFGVRINLLADILTKPVAYEFFEEVLCTLSGEDPSVQVEEKWRKMQLRKEYIFTLIPTIIIVLNYAIKYYR